MPRASGAYFGVAFSGFTQHEIDHLDGVLMLDRLDPDQRKAALREMRRAQFDDAGAARAGAHLDAGDTGRRL